MKHLILSLLFCLFFNSCNKKKQEVTNAISKNEIRIPLIEKNKKDPNFKLKNGVLFFDDVPFSGVVKEFYSNNIIKSTSEYYQGKKEGTFFGFYPNSKKWFERYYAEGIKIGTHIGWFENGQQMFEYELNNKGVYNGSVKDWHFNGQLARHFHFINGKEEGSQKMWQDNGKIRANFFTVNGDRHGLIGLKNCVSILTNEQN